MGGGSEKCFMWKTKSLTVTLIKTKARSTQYIYITLIVSARQDSQQVDLVRDLPMELKHETVFQKSFFLNWQTEKILQIRF